MTRCVWKHCVYEWSNRWECVFSILHHMCFVLEIGASTIFFFLLVENSCHCCFLFCTVIINPVTSFSSFYAEPVQSCQSTAVLQIPGSDPWKERWVFLSPVSCRVHYWPCLLKPNPSHASKLRKSSAYTVVYRMYQLSLGFMLAWYRYSTRRLSLAAIHSCLNNKHVMLALLSARLF